ncbi:hypothetical protein Ae168Ps1_6198 [Pseudonocardia sp. Ae168_Ps1]|uniref:hypothetical protein n=1 Tax=unclassified Pseudonocardia TaxID=2619320 RepID=UPI00094B329D|nr:MULTISPECIES: hypothetical protein [unclassified Pseudonocardia]OLL70451.1 hypothetical protein Ae168Ps1_6198 [Pseudonocardia sp. Ae168_Ps1]OLL71570.1 hypothetical protein Ae263Ps1_6058 [Pseudonocardia sp. Ae263_Ps1]
MTESDTSSAVTNQAVPAARASVLGELAGRLLDLNAECALLLDRTLAAERAYVEAVANALEAERITWWDVVEARPRRRSAPGGDPRRAVFRRF